MKIEIRHEEINVVKQSSDHDTRGLDPRQISLETINNQPAPSKSAVVATTAHTASNVREPIIDPARFFVLDESATHLSHCL